MKPVTGYRDPAPREESLGAVVSTHEQAKTLAGRIAMSLFLFGPGAFFAVKSAANGIPIFPSDAIGVVQASCLVFYVVMPLLGVVTIVNALRHRGDRVVVHESGIVVQGLGGAKVIPFADVTSLQSRVVRTRGGVVHAHTVRWPGGEVVLGEAYDKIDDLATRLRVGTAPTLAAKVLADHEAGRTVAFGPLRLEKDRLLWTGARLPLNEFGRIELLAGRLTLSTRTGETWASLDAAQVANLHVLLLVLEPLAKKASLGHTGALAT